MTETRERAVTSEDDELALANFLGRKPTQDELDVVSLAGRDLAAFATQRLLARTAGVDDALRRTCDGPGIAALRERWSVAMAIEVADELATARLVESLDGHSLPTVELLGRAPRAEASFAADVVAHIEQRSADAMQLIALEVESRPESTPSVHRFAIGLVSPDRLDGPIPSSEPDQTFDVAPLETLRRPVTATSAQEDDEDGATSLLDRLASSRASSVAVAADSRNFSPREYEFERWSLPELESILVGRAHRRAIGSPVDARAMANRAAIHVCRALSASGSSPIALSTGIHAAGASDVERGVLSVALVEGLRAASHALRVPITSVKVEPGVGEGPSGSVFVATVGLVERSHRLRPRCFRKSGESIVVLGGGDDDAEESEQRTQEAVREMILAEFLSSVHVIGEDGLAAALATCCQGPDSVGGRVELDDSDDSHATLFASSRSAYVLSLGFECLDGVQGIAEEAGVECREVGEVGGDGLDVSLNGERVISESIAAMRAAIARRS